ADDRRAARGALLPRRSDRKSSQEARAALQPDIPVLTEAAPEPAVVASEQPKDENPDVSLETLRTRVSEARRQYVGEDYTNTNRWLKVKSFFGSSVKQEKSADTEYYQAQYNNALIDLRNAELAKIRQLGLEGKELHTALAGTLKYFKYDELVNVSNDRTQVRAEHQGFPGKVAGMIETIGRGYNSLSFKQKALASGALFGLAGVTGGVSLVAGRLFSGSGAAVALEAVAEKIADRRQGAKAEKEAHSQVEMLEKNTFWNEKRSHEADALSLNEMIEKDIFSLDERLQKNKRAALLRKTAAFGIGFGGGYFAKELFDMAGGDALVKGGKEAVMNTWGGNEAADWIKGRFGEAVSGAHIAPVSGSIEMPDVPQAAAEAKAGLISGFVNQDIRVGEGDSIWKIGGTLADQLGLEGAQRTHFIDTLKDQYGDVLLKEGEMVNFSAHGIDKDFVEKALGQSHMLTEGQMASISANDAHLAAYAHANPDITLTNEVTDNILTAALYNDRADDWYAQIFRAHDIASGQDWMMNKEAAGRVKLRDIFNDAKLFQQGAASGHTTGLNREQITNFAAFFQGATTDDIGFDRKAFFQEHPNATVTDYLNTVAPLVSPGQRIGSYTTK
ncbi:MAG: hypothetical protein WAW00_01890, partial [Candidatus Moraniibacteriota bacterium]